MDYKISNYKNKRYITIPKVSELGLKHVFTTIDMDIGIKTNKSLEDVKKNIESVYDFLDIKPKILYNGFQSHLDSIEVIENINQGEVGPLGRFIPKTDGLITDKKDIALITRFADCTPILLFDPVKMVQANIHSGWRGTLLEIGSKGIDIMIGKFKSEPKDIIAIFGASIDKDSFEVDKDVMELFNSKFNYEDMVFKKNNTKYLINLKLIIENSLLNKGIRKENIIDIDLSTYTSPELLHSYRRDKDKYGLMGLITFL